MTDDPKALKDQRIHVLMTEQEVQAVDDWSFAHRIKSRGEAMRRLCQIGIALDERLPKLMKKYLDAVNAFADARAAVRAIRDTEEVDVVALASVLAVEAQAALDVAQLGTFFFSEMSLIIQPLKAKTGPLAESMALSGDLAKRLGEMDPTNSADNKTLASFLRAIAGADDGSED